MKLSLMLSSLFLLAACGNPGGISPNPLPSASALATEFAYSLPLSLQLQPECQLAETTTQYGVSTDGLFTFPVSEGPPNLFESGTVETRTSQLSSTELAALDAVLESNDLATAKKSSTAIPDDAPQTTECRTVSVLNLQVNDAAKSYDRNGRAFSHTKAYGTQWDAIRTHLEKLAESKRDNTPISSEAKYAFPPLKLEAQMECGGGTTPRYEIQHINQFISYSSDGSSKSQRELTAAESKRLQAILLKADLAEKKKDSVAIPADAPQTKECRSVDVLSLPVYGVSTSYDRNGRDFQHSTAYSESFNEIIEVLSDFDQAK